MFFLVGGHRSQDRSILSAFERMSGAEYWPPSQRA